MSGHGARFAIWELADRFSLVSLMLPTRRLGHPTHWWIAGDAGCHELGRLFWVNDPRRRAR